MPHITFTIRKLKIHCKKRASEYEQILNDFGKDLM